MKRIGPGATRLLIGSPRQLFGKTVLLKSVWHLFLRRIGERESL
jgi:hypothetical protein